MAKAKIITENRDSKRTHKRSKQSRRSLRTKQQYLEVKQLQQENAHDSQWYNRYVRYTSDCRLIITVGMC